MRARLVLGLAVSVLLTACSGQRAEARAAAAAAEVCEQLAQELETADDYVELSLVRTRIQRDFDVPLPPLRAAVDEACPETIDRLEARSAELLASGNETRGASQDEAANVEDEAAEQAPQRAERGAPEPAEPDKPASLGSALEVLHQRCAEGDMTSCDDLYMESPWDSQEEAFGASCGERRADRSTGVWCVDVVGGDAQAGSGGAPTSDEENYHLLLAAWQTLSAGSQDSICRQVRLGMSEAVEGGRASADGSGGMVTATEAAAFLRAAC